VDGIELFNIASVSVARYRYRSIKIPNPYHAGQPRLNGRNRGEPAAGRPARRVRRAAWGNGPGAIPTPRPGPTQPAGDGAAEAAFHQRQGRVRGRFRFLPPSCFRSAQDLFRFQVRGSRDGVALPLPQYPRRYGWRC
jgi:hypothetical protein